MAKHFKPDALAMITEGARTYRFWLEIDMSSVASAEMRHKLLIHERYRTLLFSQHYGADADTSVTLVLTTGPRRAANLAELAKRDGLRHALFADVAAFAAHDCDPLYDPIWRSPLTDDLIPLFGPGSGTARLKGQS